MKFSISECCLQLREVLRFIINESFRELETKLSSIEVEEDLTVDVGNGVDCDTDFLGGEANSDSSKCAIKGGFFSADISYDGLKEHGKKSKESL